MKLFKSKVDCERRRFRSSIAGSFVIALIASAIIKNTFMTNICHATGINAGVSFTMETSIPAEQQVTNETLLPSAGITTNFVIPQFSESKEENAEVLSEEIKVAIEDVEDVKKYINISYGTLNVRKEPDVNSEVIDSLKINNSVNITGVVDGSEYVRIKYQRDGEEEVVGFVSKEYLSDTEVEIKVVQKVVSSNKTTSTSQSNYNGAVLNRSCGTVQGPSGKETYYNLPMQKVVNMMHSRGIAGDYWVRGDGVKMFGDYVMVATDTRRYPKGTLIQTSLGVGIVADHCGSAQSYGGIWLDIAVTW